MLYEKSREFVDELVARVEHIGVEPEVVHFVGVCFQVKEFTGAIVGSGLWRVVDAEFVAVFSPHGDVQFRVVIAPARGARVAVHADGIAALLQGVGVQEVACIGHEVGLFASGDGECGCGNVVKLAGRVDDLTAGCVRHADDHGHPGAGVVHVRAFDGEAVVAEHVAVVAGKDDDGVVRKICIVECLQDAPDLFVDEGDGRVVADAAFAQGVR